MVLTKTLKDNLPKILNGMVLNINKYVKSSRELDDDPFFHIIHLDELYVNHVFNTARRMGSNCS